MEEDEYKSTYNELAAVTCVFEKALTNHQAKCRLSRHFCLADREGYSCEDAQSSAKCREFLDIVREKSTFVLKLHEISGPLPHNMEIRVQAGGLMGLAKLVEADAQDQSKQPVIDDINRILNAVKNEYGAWGNLPYSKIVQSVLQFQGRRRRR